jgi:hypothetical protein
LLGRGERFSSVLFRRRDTALLGTEGVDWNKPSVVGLEQFRVLGFKLVEQRPLSLSFGGKVGLVLLDVGVDF